MTTHAPATIEAFDCIGGERIPLTGDAITSHNPAQPDQIVWQGSPELGHVDRAVAEAAAQRAMWAEADIAKRVEVLLAFQTLAKERAEEFADLICRETGKAMWDAKAEAGIIAGKVGVTLDESPGAGRNRIAPIDLDITETRKGAARFRPHGVMAVVGPFNFPAHLPNGHIVPALLAGNTIVFKPSDKAPATGQLLASLYREALTSCGFPAGIVNLVQGVAETAKALVSHPEVDGILFTGSWPVGRAILEANLDRPGRIVALEMGGNNPSVIMDDAHLQHAAVEVARAAFITTGQRCTCTRRAIVHKDIAADFVPLVAKIASNLVIGDPRGVAGEQPFCGPLVTAGSRDAVLDAQRRFVDTGGRVVLESAAIDHPSGGHYITPGILQVDRFTRENEGPGCDEEVFGPLLRVAVVDSFEDALEQANATRFGLAAAVFTQREEIQRSFLQRARAGCVNVNTGTAGASGKLPFGGLGISGNHRPAGSFSLDYCAYPVASLIETDTSQIAPPPGMLFDPSW